MKTDNTCALLESAGTDTNLNAEGLTEEFTIEEAARGARRFSRKFCADAVDVGLGNG